MRIDALLIHISTSYLGRGNRNEDMQLGQYYIAEYANQFGYNVRVKKFLSTEPIVSMLIDLLGKFDCQVIGFYVDSENIWTIRRVLFPIKERMPKLKIIVGGPQVTGDAVLALNRIPSADIAIIGEGEIPFTSLLQAFANNSTISNINGLAFRELDKVVFTKPSKQSSELVQFPFPKRKKYSLDDNVTFNHISTGRGCIGRCAFCFEGTKKRNMLRIRPIDDVIEEIDYVVNNLGQYKYITFVDDTFILNRQRTELICKHLKDNYGGNIKWFCEARVDVLSKHVDLLPILKDAGLIRIQLGGESGSQKILDAYNKKMRIPDLKNIVKKIYKNGISSVYINYIIGGAFESIETFKETLDLAIELLNIAPGCAEVGCSLFSPYVGTPMYNSPSAYGIRIVDRNLVTGPDGYMAFVETDNLNKYKIFQLRSIFEQEIKKTQIKLIKHLSYNSVFNQYKQYRDVGLMTTWLEILNTNETIKNYFESILDYHFISIRNLSLEEIRGSVPFRTSEPISDGEAFYKTTYRGDYVKLSGLEEYVFLLSSGKISFEEIVMILSRNHKFEGISDLEKQIFNIYVKLDTEYLIVWRNVY